MDGGSIRGRQGQRIGERAFLLFLTALAMLGSLATNLYLPSLPGLARDLGVDLAAAQLTLTLFLGGFAVAQLVVGPLSDRFGRRPVLLAGLALYVAASLACMAAASLGLLLVFRLAQAIGACVGAVLVRAIARDLFEGPALTRALSVITTLMAVAPGFSPLVGGLVETVWGWRGNFALVAATGVAATALAWRWIAESNRAPLAALSPRRVAADYRQLLADGRFLVPTAATSLALGGLFAYFAASPAIFIERIGVPPALFGCIPAVSVFAVFGGGSAAPRLAAALGERRALAGGLTLMALGGGLLFLVLVQPRFGVVAVVLPLLLYLFGMGVVNPLATAAALRPFAQNAGAASALIGFCQMGAGMLGTLAVSAVPAQRLEILPVTMAACGIVGLLVLSAGRLRPAPRLAAAAGLRRGG